MSNKKWLNKFKKGKAGIALGKGSLRFFKIRRSLMQTIWYYWLPRKFTNSFWPKFTGKIARFFINFHPKCTCGCNRSAKEATWIALGFKVVDGGEISVKFADGTSCIDMLPTPGIERTYPDYQSSKIFKAYESGNLTKDEWRKYINIINNEEVKN